uniref:Large ribosomal subunit protein uL18 n=1 Tax=uncultured Acidobacteria bacterium Rifle_16ft_4_minimus_23617 TaxID=1665082 RepID=A0A0H4T227_9BACT|nr:50S ribosomal protein L18, large subunit ribosomal protein L18 [uncultured Acidobacteria bacterium Rifle_16ft_4_minimus_23617]
MRFGRARKPVAKISRTEHRRQIHRRVRQRVAGTEGRPRLSVSRSLKHIYTQIIDDAQGRTLVSASSRDKEVRQQLRYGGNVAAAKVVGTVLGERARQAGITRVVFDRGGYKYHGRIKALADAVRKAGLNF